MDKSITPSGPLTDGQIGKLNEKIAAKLRKNSKEIPHDVFQDILGDTTLIDEIHLAIRKRIEARNNFIIRVVNVNRTRTPQEALTATGRAQYVTDSVVAAMPKGDDEEVEVVFFKVGRTISEDQLEKEYELRGLKPADPYSQATVNEVDPAFADKYPNGTQWKDADGKWCFAAFGRFGSGRYVSVRRYVYGWDGRWWFGGVRKISALGSDTVVS